MNTFIKKAALLVSLFCTTQMYAQFDFSPLPDYTTSPEKLNKFIRDSIEEHQKTMVNWGTPHKYLVPHKCANRKGKLALVGFDHQPITDFEFDDINGDWHDNVYLVRKGKLYGCVDTTGKVLVPVNYPQVYLSNPGRLITTGTNGLVFDRNGKVLLPEGYRGIGSLNLGHKTVIKARQEFDDSLTIFDVDGKKIITCNGFDIESINFVNNNRYIVKVSSDFFTPVKVVDSNLVEIVPPIFRNVVWANDTYVFGRQASPGNAGLYSLNEKKYYPLPYEVINEPLKDQSGFIVETENGKYGVIDNNLKEVLPCQFSNIEQLRDKDLFIVRTFNDNAGLINGKGQFILDTVYFNIWPVIIPEPINRENIRSNPSIFPGSKPLPTDFIRLADHESHDLIYQIDKNSFLKGAITILTPDLYIQRLDDGKDRLIHHNGNLISMIERCWQTPNLMVVVQQQPNINGAQVYDISGNFLKELDSWPTSVEIPYREFYIWTAQNGKVGILDPTFSPIIAPKYDAIYKLKEIPIKFTDLWVKYAFQNLEHPFLGWIWDTDKTVPLLIKENGEVVSIVELN